MKMSQMTNDQITELIIRITPAVSNIMDDEEMQPLLDKVAGSREMPLAKLIPSLLPPVVTFALRKHKADLYEIVGAFSGKSVKEVGKMNILDTMNIIKDSIDKDFTDFFRSFGGQELIPAEE